MTAPSHCSSVQGFYVFQTALGSPLQFHPALGTNELDSLMDAYLPCPGSIQDKRASISVDFFEHYRCTGESVKFYQVPDYWVGSTTGSPNSAHDSGYGSSFTASPMASTWSWGPALATAAATASTPSTSSAASTPHVPSQSLSRRRKQPSARQSTSSPRATMSDFSDLPGMKILTKDGRDVTNTATRGCKTKEQRDHAHLMRIVKACDSCKRKKVRCDPSHRSRAGLASVATLLHHSTKEARPFNQACKPQMPVPPLEPAVPGEFALIPPLTHTFELEPFDFVHETPADELASWDEFLNFHDEPSNVFSGGLDDLELGLDHFPDLQSPLDSPPRPPVLSTVGELDTKAYATVCQEAVPPVSDVPGLPYLERNRTPHHYVDFNLFSPSSSFSDAEPVFSGDLRDGPDLSRTQAGHHSRDDVANRTLAIPTAGSSEVGLQARSPDHKESLRSSRLQTWLSASSPRPRLDMASFGAVAGPVATMVATHPLPTSSRSSLEGLSETNGRRRVTNANVAQSTESQPPSWSSASHVARLNSHSAAPTELHGTKSREPVPVYAASSPQVDATACQNNATRHPSSDMVAPADIRSRIYGGGRRPVEPSLCRHASYNVPDGRPGRIGTTESTDSTPVERKPDLFKVKATAAVQVESADRVVDEISVKNHRIAVGPTRLTTIPDRIALDATSDPSASKVLIIAMAVTLGLIAALCCSIGMLSAGIDLGGSNNAMWVVSCAVVYALSRLGQETDGPGTTVKGLQGARSRARVEAVFGGFRALV